MVNIDQKIHSQNGEDGVLQEIYKNIGVKTKYFVEFGVEDGRECNTRYLREHCGWTGLMMDGRFENKLINLQKEFITAENINDLFDKYEVPFEFDLLSIDIDGNDYWIWQKIDHKPRVVIIEINADLGYTDKKVMRYNPEHVWAGDYYYGASIQALIDLGKSKGYSLVYVERHCVNAFFVLNSELGQEYNDYKIPANPKGHYGSSSNRHDWVNV
jgi:hypothetical protein